VPILISAIALPAFVLLRALYHPSRFLQRKDIDEIEHVC
jgi:hypothetical protein